MHHLCSVPSFPHPFRLLVFAESLTVHRASRRATRRQSLVDVATGESAEVMLEAIEDELDDAGEGDEECEQTVEGRGKKPVIRLHKVFPRDE
jgi:hypothetical protein